MPIPFAVTEGVMRDAVTELLSARRRASITSRCPKCGYADTQAVRIAEASIIMYAERMYGQDGDGDVSSH